MMTKNDYEVIASAFKNSLTLAERLKVYRNLVPYLLADNGKFNPILFGEALRIPRLMCREILISNNTKEVIEDAST